MNPSTLPTQPVHQALAAPTARRRKPWWVYLLWILGSLFGLVVVLLVSAWLYWNSLVRTYTSTTPKELPKVEASDDAFAQLQSRWDSYFLLFIRRNQTIPPFEITGEELNLFAHKFGPFRKEGYVQIVDKQLRLLFSTSLDKTGNASLRGRYLNGTATFVPEYKDNHLVLHLTAVEANNKPIPNWILRRFQSVDFASRLNRRPEFDLAFRALDRIELEPDKITLHPTPTGAR